MNCDDRQPIQDAFTPATNAGKRYKLTLKPERGKISTPYVNLFNGSHISEIRAKAEEGIGRAFYCTLVGRRIVILHGFIKKTDKTPGRELEIARNRMKEVLQHG
jgi:phage-related protein